MKDQLNSSLQCQQAIFQLSFLQKVESKAMKKGMEHAKNKKKKTAAIVRKLIMPRLLEALGIIRQAILE